MPPASSIRTTKKSAEPYRDRLNPTYATNAAATERQRRLERFQRLAQFIQEGGQSWVTSTPGAKVMRIEARPNISSALAAKLTTLGYQVAICGLATRIVPNAVIDVDVIEIVLPGK